MSTTRIYRDNVYVKGCCPTITDVIEKDGHDVIVCDSSVFFPEGGGQPCDKGSVSFVESNDDCGETHTTTFSITDCYDTSLEGDVYHVTDAPYGTFKPGDSVILKLDWERRLSNMQRHLGEHMLSGCMWKLYGGINKGFHMGEDYITIDIDLGGRMLSSEELERASEVVNHVIWEDRPVTISYFDDYEASKVMPVRKDVPHDGKVSVVTVAGEDCEPFDCIACCGTHPSSTGQVGIISIYKLEPNKGMNRIYFDCGMKAYRKLSAELRTLTEVANRFSSGTDELLHKLDVRDEKEAKLRDRLNALSQYAKENMIAELQGKLQDQLVIGNVATLECSLFDTNELLKIGFELASRLGEEQLLILLSPAECTALLYGGAKVDCGKIIKSSAAEFNGRGGGRPDSARAVFGSEKDLKAWARKENPNGGENNNNN